MKVVLQKVKSASVTVDNQIVSSIGRGLLLLVGITTDDTIADVEKLSSKILKLRVFEAAATTTTTEVGEGQGQGQKLWASSVSDSQDLQILSVSQFTLYGIVKKGSKPDFHKAAKNTVAKPLYDEFLSKLRQGLDSASNSETESRVKDGVFGAMMDVALVNDGPITLVWDTKEK